VDHDQRSGAKQTGGNAAHLANSRDAGTTINLMRENTSSNTAAMVAGETIISADRSR
jgi:hypothetical protein